MPPRLPVLAAPSRCSDLFVSALTQRLAAVSLSTTARLAAPRQQVPASSGAAFLDLDKEFGRPRRDAPSSSSAASHSHHHHPSAHSRTSNLDANAALSRVLFDSETRRRMHERREEQKRTALERMEERKVSDDYARQMPRRWRVGDLYAPHDLSPAEANKWRRFASAKTDVLDILALNPVDEYRNFALVSEFMTPMGRIRHSRETGLRPVNQRRMAKAIRRAIGLGLHPSVHRHPEILAAEVAHLPKPSYATGEGGRSGGGGGRRRR